VLGFSINDDLIDFNFGLFRNPIQPSFSFLLLHFEGDTLNRSFLDSFHEVGGKSRNLIPELFSWDFCDLW
jgi:hypothetical protein